MSEVPRPLPPGVRTSIIDLPVKPLILDDVAALAAADPDHRYELQEGTC